MEDMQSQAFSQMEENGFTSLENCGQVCAEAQLM